MPLDLSRHLTAQLSETVYRFRGETLFDVIAAGAVHSHALVHQLEQGDGD